MGVIYEARTKNVKCVHEMRQPSCQVFANLKWEDAVCFADMCSFNSLLVNITFV